MQPFRLSLEGDYWDSQLYSGRLYLWKMSGELQIIDWDRLIDSVASSPHHAAFEIALKDAGYLYAYDFQRFYAIGDVQAQAMKAFEAAASRGTVAISSRDLSLYEIQRIDSPFGELHDDCEVYNRELYALTDKGLFQLGIRPKNKSGLGRNAVKLDDVRGSAIRAKGSRLAISALDNGLYEWSSFHGRLSQISTLPTSWADWMSASIYCSSDQGSYMAAYHYQDRNVGDDQGIANRLKAGFEVDYDDELPRRSFDGLILSRDIFRGDGLSWGIDDKVYQAQGDVLSVAVFENRRFKTEPNDLLSAFSERPSIRFDRWKGRIIRGGAAYFGTIVELENALVVIGSDGRNRTYPGPFVRWRTFPRSLRYENQLHLICEDSLEILAFSHDWFVDQNSKIAGVRHSPSQKGYAIRFRRR